MLCKSGRFIVVNAGFWTIDRLDVELSSGRSIVSNVLVPIVRLPLLTFSRLPRLRVDI